MIFNHFKSAFLLNRVMTFHILIITLIIAGINISYSNVVDTERGHIKPYGENVWYWQYDETPVVLIGASDQDNLFQWTGKQLTDQLDLLVSVGGNYLCAAHWEKD